MLTSSDLLKGPIAAQEEDGPTLPGCERQKARPVSDCVPPFEPDSPNTRARVVPPGCRDSIGQLTGYPAAPVITDDHVITRPVLRDGNHVRNRVMENLRNVSGVLPRDQEDDPPVPNDAPRIVSSQAPQNPGAGAAAPSGTPQFTGTYTWVWATTRADKN